jgi:hypothetical protein
VAGSQAAAAWADLLDGDPAPLEQAFVVLTAIIGAVDRRVRGQPAPGRPECDMYVRLPAEDRNSVS